MHVTGQALAIVPFLGATRSIFHVLSCLGVLCCFKRQLLRVTFSCSFRSGSIDPPTFEDISLDSFMAPSLVTITLEYYYIHFPVSSAHIKCLRIAHGSEGCRAPDRQVARVPSGGAHTAYKITRLSQVLPDTSM